MGDLVCSCSSIHGDAVLEAREGMKTAETYKAMAALYKLFGDPTRIKILHALEQRELCVCDLASLLGLTKSAVSHQLKELRLANLVKFRREGQVVFYFLADEHVKQIIDMALEHINE